MYTRHVLGDDRCLGYRIDRQSEYRWITYEEVHRRHLKVPKTSDNYSRLNVLLLRSPVV